MCMHGLVSMAKYSLSPPKSSVRGTELRVHLSTTSEGPPFTGAVSCR